MENDKHSFLYYFFKKVLYIITTVSPVLATRLVYFYHCKKNLNLKNPETFDEKINYLKLYKNINNELITKCADKIAVRDYVSSKGLNRILIKTIGIYENANDIEWSNLPNSFVIKCNHGCGFNIVCHNKNDYNELEVKRKLNKWLSIDYGKYTSEIHYCNIEPKIIIEKDISDGQNDLVDYKIFCFDGNPKYIEVITGREKENTYYEYYDLNWNKCNFTKKEYSSDKIASKPDGLTEMLEIARTLSKDFKFVRVDLYNVKKKIYFGELTFTPSGGCCKKFTDEGAITLGNCINLELKGKKD